MTAASECNFRIEKGLYVVKGFKTLKDKATVFIIAIAAALVLFWVSVPLGADWFQDAQQQKQAAMPGMDMGKTGSGQDSEAAQGANMAMSGHDMDMGAHMFMTELRPSNAGDEKRAAEIVAELRPAIEKYKDYKVALAEGFVIFLPDVPQSRYHFTSYDMAVKRRRLSIRRIQLRYFTQNRTMDTCWRGRCIRLRGATPKTT